MAKQITPLHHCTIAPLQHYTIATLHHCNIVPYQHIQIRRCGYVPFHHDTIDCTVSPFHHIAIVIPTFKLDSKSRHKVEKCINRVQLNQTHTIIDLLTNKKIEVILTDKILQERQMLRIRMYHSKNYLRSQRK